MQVLQVEGFEKRIVDNVPNVYVNQIARGQSYLNHNDVVGITICDFALWPDTTDCKLPMLTRWRTTEQATGPESSVRFSSYFWNCPSSTQPDRPTR